MPNSIKIEHDLEYNSEEALCKQRFFYKKLSNNLPMATDKIVNDYAWSMNENVSNEAGYSKFVGLFQLCCKTMPRIGGFMLFLTIKLYLTLFKSKKLNHIHAAGFLCMPKN